MPPEEQKIHDRVLADSAHSYLKVTTAENIFTNSGGQKNHDIEGQYPDVIAKLPTGEIILEEIETESTVSEKSMEKWRKLLTLGHELRIIVPLTRIEEAKALTQGFPNLNLQAYDASGEEIQWFGRNR